MSEARIDRARKVVEALLDRKAENVVALDVRELSSIADTFVIASGTSDRHVRTLADATRAALREEGETPLGVEGYEDGRWILMDLNDRVVHLFLPELREYYDLDRLWSDATRLPFPDTGEARTAG